MSRLLTQLDPNLPPRPSPSTAPTALSSPSDDSCPATPSKDKFREWTFPRTSAGPNPSASTSSSAGGPPSTAAPQSHRVHSLADGSHGRSSSVTPNKHTSPNKGNRSGAGAESMDLRHRSNASLAQSPSSPLLPRTLLSPSVSAAPKEVARLIYSNVRRKGSTLHDLPYYLVFGAALLLFARAILGVGFDGAAIPRSSAAAVRMADRGPHAGPGAGTGASVPAPVVDVQLPEGFLPHEHEHAAHPDEFLADVHQPHGDSSHDAGEDHFQASPDDPALEDEHVHTHHASSDPLWPEDPAHLDRDAEAAARPRPRPARLAPQEDERPAVAEAEAAGETGKGEEEEEDEEERRLVELVEAHEAEEREAGGEEPDVVYEGEEEEDVDPAAARGGADDEQVLVVDDGEPEDDADTDEEEDDALDAEDSSSSLTAQTPPPPPGALHVIDADDDDALLPGALSALEELLDSAQEEEAAAARAKKGGAGADADEVAREALRRAQRGREALARAQAKARRDAPPVVGRVRARALAPLPRAAGAGEGKGAERRRMVRAKKVRR
ncbi:hypothetical protein DMC30DRAFT_394609 [Rhodotorula diobovata]|uniref:Uncharacterized protein n=1 Tax=Rhodotorula diobovata TaxID=5288 RepID=A0A5C5FXF3_9BASI|nr:hypothetical protein DMC30DRAFT_394609 [Rhodotorula diobovata]